MEESSRGLVDQGVLRQIDQVRTLGDVSEQREDNVMAPSKALTINDLARLQQATEVGSLGELAADIWDSDEELVEFLADLRSSRSSSLD